MRKSKRGGARPGSGRKRLRGNIDRKLAIEFVETIRAAFYAETFKAAMEEDAGRPETERQSSLRHEWEEVRAVRDDFAQALAALLTRIEVKRLALLRAKLSDDEKRKRWRQIKEDILGAHVRAWENVIAKHEKQVDAILRRRKVPGAGDDEAVAANVRERRRTRERPDARSIQRLRKVRVHPKDVKTVIMPLIFEQAARWIERYFGARVSSRSVQDAWNERKHTRCFADDQVSEQDLLELQRRSDAVYPRRGKVVSF